MLTQGLFNQLKWNVFHDSVYSPDLVSSNYHLIPSLKCDLGGRHFIIEDDLQSAIAEFFAKQDPEACLHTIGKPQQNLDEMKVSLKKL